MNMQHLVIFIVVRDGERVCHRGNRHNPVHVAFLLEYFILLLFDLQEIWMKDTPIPDHLFLCK